MEQQQQQQKLSKPTMEQKTKAKQTMLAAPNLQFIKNRSGANSMSKRQGSSGAIQPVHVISSDDDNDGDHDDDNAEDNKDELTKLNKSKSNNKQEQDLRSCSVDSYLAGFSSPGGTLAQLSSDTSKSSQKRCSAEKLQLQQTVSQEHKQSECKEMSAQIGALPNSNMSDQIVEVNSNSTTTSQKEKRLLRNSRLQMKLQLTQQQRLAANAALRHSNHQNHNNKGSSESSSEFPLSSPSNPGAGDMPDGGGVSKFSQRPALLKNTLPADSFERYLAILTTTNPQMTLKDKMNAWRCSEELSDVEDVNNFDEQFRKREELRRKRTKTNNK